MGLWDFLRRLFGASTYDPATGNRLYVGNLSYKVKEDELRALFSKHGKVRTLHLIRDRITRRLKGYAFIEMSNEDASRALALNGVDFLGRKLVVSMAKSKKGTEEQRTHQPRQQNAPRQQRQPQQPQEQSTSSGQSSSGRGDRHGRRQRSSGERWRKNRSGPKAYGGDKNDNTPLPRYE